jgi:ADP-ribose pyrophosphatase YjhB (NUDIX family)
MIPEIRLRAAIAVVQAGKILLVPHFDTDAGPIQWTIPGGGVEFGEQLQTTAKREFKEETGLDVVCESLLDVVEIIVPERPYHSVGFYYQGRVTGGDLKQEMTRWGPRTPRWFSLDELAEQPYHPAVIVRKALQARA